MIKGLIINSDLENAENMKFIIETVEKHVKVEILQMGDKHFKLVDMKKYDFIVNATDTVHAKEMIDAIKPFAKTVMNKEANYITLLKNKVIEVVDRTQILGIEVIGKSCFIHSLDETIEVKRISLTNLLEVLEDPYLMRCHKSYAVNIRYVNRFIKETRNRWRLKFIVDTDFDCRVTEFYRDEVMKKCEEFHCIKKSEFIGLW